MSGCTDPSIGNLLHAYELQILSEEEMDRIEIHLMSCQECITELENFRHVAIQLQSDNEVKELILHAKDEESKAKHTEPFFRKLWDHFWPNTSLVLKPAFVYILVLLMIVPAYNGIQRLKKDEIRSVQSLTLFPGRASGDEVLKISTRSDGLISFYFKEAVVGESYYVVIESKDGSEIFRDNDFTDFDESNTGRLILPLTQMKPGSFRLTITDPRSEPPYNRREYRFRIED